jgi:hypothetical protein
VNRPTIIAISSLLSESSDKVEFDNRLIKKDFYMNELSFWGSLFDMLKIDTIYIHNVRCLLPSEELKVNPS